MANPSKMETRKTADAASAGDILAALEYETAKEDRPLTKRLLDGLGLKRASPPELAKQIALGPGVEAFVIMLLAEMRPFARMMQELYAFFSARLLTVGHGARQLRISRAGAKARLDIDLTGFPCEYVSVISEAPLEISILRPFEGVSNDAPSRLDEVNKAWGVIRPVPDEDYYGHPFWRALSYAHAKRPSLSELDWERLEARVTPLLDRLATVVDLLDLGVPGLERLNYHYPSVLDLQAASPPVVHARTHMIAEHDARRFAAQMARPNPMYSPEVEFASTLNSIGLLLGGWAAQTVRAPRGRNTMEIENYGASLSELDGGRYVDVVLQRAGELEALLDRVLPVVDRREIQALIKTIVELLRLPFWRERPFVYELWCLVTTLSAAERSGTVEILGLTQRGDGGFELTLPAQPASGPVARISGAGASLEVWAQRCTWSPATGDALSPDLRISRPGVVYPDLLVLECKDRRKMPFSTLAPIVERYASGTGASELWFVNYERFEDVPDELPVASPEQHIQIASRVQPGALPQAYLDAVERALSSIRPPSLPPPPEPVVLTPTPLTSTNALTLTVMLTWGALPADLDLHGWISVDGERSMLSFQSRAFARPGCEAVLDKDVRCGFGPEIITVRSDKSFSLHVGVHAYNGSESVGGSGARVQITSGTETILDRVAPRGQGAWWDVGVISVARAHVELRDQLSSATPRALRDP